MNEKRDVLKEMKKEWKFSRKEMIKESVSGFSKSNNGRYLSKQRIKKCLIEHEISKV
jgi:hypothetical protein